MKKQKNIKLLDAKQLEELLKQIELEHSLDPLQTKAIENAFSYDFSLISGYAGSGKSYVISLLEKYLKASGWNVVKIAPTGRAALRIGGRTIHSWLLPRIIENPNNPDDFFIDGFKRSTFHEDFTPHSKVCILVDESSMIDSELNDYIMNAFNNSLRKNYVSKLIFVGDSAQLEPVGEGKPFIDFLNEESNPKVFLEKIFRNKEGNDIPIFANHILQNGMPTQIRDFKNVKISSRVQAIVEVANNTDVQIIAPFNNACLEINLHIQKRRLLLNRLNTDETIMLEEWDSKSRKYIKTFQIYGQDKILITKNHISGDVMNGTTGYVSMVVDVDDGTNRHPHVKIIEETTQKEIYIPYGWFVRHATLGYAMTVHKAQGSQWENAYYVFSHGVDKMGDPIKMHYTAITRASKGLKVIVKKEWTEGEYERAIALEAPKEEIKLFVHPRSVPVIKASKENFSDEFLEFINSKKVSKKPIDEEVTTKVNSSRVTAKLELIALIEKKYPQEAQLLKKRRYAEVFEWVHDKYPDKANAIQDKLKRK